MDSPLPADPAALVEAYLRTLMIPDPAGARRFIAPGGEFGFTGAPPSTRSATAG